MIKEADNFKTATGILSGRVRRVGGNDAWKYTLHMKNCQTPNTWPLSISFPFSGLQVLYIIFNNEHIIWGFSRLVFKVIQNVSEFRNSLFRTNLKIITIHHEHPCRIEISHPRGRKFNQGRGLPSPWLNSDPEGEISLSYMDRLMMDRFSPTFRRVFVRK